MRRREQARTDERPEPPQRAEAWAHAHRRRTRPRGRGRPHRQSRHEARVERRRDPPARRELAVGNAGRQPGEAIQLGDHGTLYGDLFGSAKGKAIGQFYGSRLAVQAAPGGHTRADASVEVHTFVLPEGTIVGMGTSVHGGAVFAIVGGTGAYADAKEPYAATQRLREHGGNGTAEFILTIRA